MGADDRPGPDDVHDSLGLGKVYINDPIEKVEGKPTRHNPNRK
jgi:hypothetical protein